MGEPIGLIAGEGMFPVLVARGVRAAGHRVICAAFVGHASESLRAEVDEFHWVGLARPGQWIRVLRRGGCREAVMVGRVSKQVAHQSLLSYIGYMPDLVAAKLWFGRLRRDKRPMSLLSALLDELQVGGIRVVDQTTFNKDLITQEGVLTRRQPTIGQWSDIAYGYDLCQQVSRMDVGQAIAVKDKTVFAVEAVEGTNAMIQRAGELCRGGGWTMIKVSNTLQDTRIDVPAVGVTTIEKLADARAACLVVEAGKTIMLELPRVLELAGKAKIALVGYGPSVARFAAASTQR